jgi:mannose-6-phosphate isomerase
MANSDNVLRAGLTTKHIDMDELMHVAIFHSHTPEILEAEGSEGRYATPSHEFALCRVSISEDYFINGRNPAQIILCTKGRLRIETAAGNPGESQSLIIQRGEAVFMPHHAGGYVVSGKGEIFMAQIPD